MAHCRTYSFCYYLEDVDYSEIEVPKEYGLLSVLNDDYLSMIDEDKIMEYINDLKDKLEAISKRKIVVFERQDTECKIWIEPEERSLNFK